jgi:hypothetical protein
MKHVYIVTVRNKAGHTYDMDEVGVSARQVRLLWARKLPPGWDVVNVERDYAHFAR